jgi:uncharacterized protein (TIGR02466 family)
MNLLNNGVNLFTPYIYKFQFPFEFEILKPKIYNLLENNSETSLLEIGNSKSSIKAGNTEQPHTWEELSEFQEWLGSMIYFIRKENKFIYEYNEVTESWINIHYKGGQTLEHSHNFITFVVTAYLQVPDNSGYIEFKDPLEYHKSIYPIFPEESLYKELPVTTNDVLIFPGWLKHRVQPNLSDHERIIFTFNIR